MTDLCQQSKSATISNQNLLLPIALSQEPRLRRRLLRSVGNREKDTDITKMAVAFKSEGSIDQLPHTTLR